MTIRIEDIAATDLSDIVDSSGQAVLPSHPGGLLRREFLELLGISQYRLTQSIGVTQTFGVADQVNALGQMDAVIHKAGMYSERQCCRSTLSLPTCSPRAFADHDD